jgi:hypothetical protein
VATFFTLCFFNFNNLSINHDVHVLVSPDTYHPHSITEVLLSVRKSNRSSNISFRKCSSGDYFLLHNFLSTHDWYSLNSGTAVDAAVEKLVVAVTEVIEKLSLLCV